MCKLGVKVRTARPRVEALEDRLVLNAGGDLVIGGTSAGDKAVVSYKLVNGAWYYQVSVNNRTTLIPVSKVTGGDVIFHGGDGDDYFRNDTRLRTAAFGGAGRDVLIGGSNTD